MDMRYGFFNLLDDALDGTLSRREVLQRASLLGLSGGALAAVLAACGGDDDAEPAATTAPGSGSTSNPTATTASGSGTSSSGGASTPAQTAGSPSTGSSGSGAAAVSGDPITVALSIAISTMDPAQEGTTMGNSADKLVFEGLTGLTAKNDLIPLLATEWSASSDGLTWTFKLRPNVTFHDGTPFNAEAAKANYDRILNKDNNLLRRNVISVITAVNVVDEMTVELKTEKPFGPMPWYVAHPGVSMHSPKAIEQYGPKDVSLHPVGTGAFMVKSYPSTELLELVRYEEYWGTKAPAPSMKVVSVPEDSSRFAQLQTGEIDFMVNLPTQLAATIKGDSNLQLITGPSNRVAHIGFNMLKPHWQDVRVRQALNHAVDKETIVKSVMQGYATIYPSVFTPFSFGYAEISTYKYDPELAKKLLTDAGWKPASDGKLSPDGQPFKMTIDTPINRYLLDQATAEAVAGYLQEIDINAVVNPMEFNTYWATRRGNEAKEVTDAYYMAWADPNGDCSYAMQQFESRTWAPGNNFGFYKNDEVDRLAAEGVQSSDPERRKEIYRQLQQIIVDDAPYIFLFALSTLGAARADVKGVELHPAEYYLLSMAYKEK